MNMEIYYMFRENNAHLQQTLLTSENYMNSAVLERLLKSWAAVFYSMVFCRIKESTFSVLYCSNNGRPNFPVNILLSLEYIKHLFNYSDEELVEQFYFNYQIAYAIGIKNVGEMNLCPGTMYEFRRKLYRHSVENPESGDLIFNQFIRLTKEFVKESKVVTDEQRMDSTMITANIKNAGRLALAYDVIEQALKVIPCESMSESMKEILDTTFKKRILYKSRGEEIISRIQGILDVGQKVIELTNETPEMQDLQEIKILKRFISEQTKTESATGKIKAKENKEIKPDSLQSAYDEDATYRSKGKKSGKGYSVNISETCNEKNDVQFITHYNIKPNITSDVAFAKDAIPEIKLNFDLKDMYVDGAYCGKDVKDIADEKHVTMHYTDMTGKKTESDEIKASEFKYNDDGTVSACPADVKPIKTTCNPQNGNISAHFSKVECENCEYKDKCCVKEQKKANKLSTTEATIEVAKLRNNMMNDRIENTSKRAAIEGTNSELKSRHGLDDVRVLGINKVSITTGLKITACNFKRFAKNCLKAFKNARITIPETDTQGIAMQI
jgi:Transposase DDE domain/Transposase domain (DUF772)